MEENKVEVNHIKSNKKGKPVLIVVLIMLALLIGGIALYFGVLTKPVNIYKGLVSSVIDSLFEENALGEAKGKQGVTIEYDLTLNLEDKEFKENPIVKALNAIDATLDMQADNDKNNYVIHLDSTYDDEEMLKASMFVSLENSKAYIYIKDIIDNYLELDLEIDNLDEFEEATISNEIKHIIKNEFKNIITDDMCFKEDGSYVLKTTNIELIDNIVKALEALAKNEELLKAVKDPDESVEIIKAYIELLDTNYMDEYELEIILDLDLLLNPKKVTVKIDGESLMEVLVNFGDDNYNFDVKLENKKVIYGDIVVRDNGKSEQIKFDFEIEELGRVELELKAMSKDIKELDKVDMNKVKKMEELSFDETMEMLSNLEESKLGEVITEIAEYNNSIINKANQAVIKSDIANLRAELSLEYADIKLANFEAQNNNGVAINKSEAIDRYEDILKEYTTLVEVGYTVTADENLNPIVIEP